MGEIFFSCWKLILVFARLWRCRVWKINWGGLMELWQSEGWLSDGSYENSCILWFSLWSSETKQRRGYQEEHLVVPHSQTNPPPPPPPCWLEATIYGTLPRRRGCRVSCTGENTLYRGFKAYRVLLLFPFKLMTSIFKEEWNSSNGSQSICLLGEKDKTTPWRPTLFPVPETPTKWNKYSSTCFFFFLLERTVMEENLCRLVNDFSSILLRQIIHGDVLSACNRASYHFGIRGFHAGTGWSGWSWGEVVKLQNPKISSCTKVMWKSTG